MKANARLIAAAPELLEALDNCATEMGLFSGQMQDIVNIPPNYTAALTTARVRLTEVGK